MEVGALPSEDVVYPNVHISRRRTKVRNEPKSRWSLTSAGLGSAQPQRCANGPTNAEHSLGEQQGSRKRAEVGLWCEADVATALQSAMGQQRRALARCWPYNDTYCSQLSRNQNLGETIGNAAEQHGTSPAYDSGNSIGRKLKAPDLTDEGAAAVEPSGIAHRRSKASFVESTQSGRATEALNLQALGFA